MYKQYLQVLEVEKDIDRRIDRYEREGYEEEVGGDAAGQKSILQH